jgi:hypothetical protein
MVIGKGLVFPIQLTPEGRPPISSDLTLLDSSIRIILSWYVGTRFFLGSFGSALEQLLREPKDETLASLVKFYTKDAISKWETRVELLDVELINQDIYSLTIHIAYKVKSTGITNTLVFPYYTQIPY